MDKEKDDIEKYQEGSLTEAERHALEKKALQDPFLSDALEGSEHVAPQEFSADIDELRNKISQRPSKSWFTPLRIAAGIIILISAGLFFYFNNQPTYVASENVPTSDELGKVKPKADSAGLLTLAKPEEKPESKSAGPLATRRAKGVQAESNTELKAVPAEEKIKQPVTEPVIGSAEEKKPEVKVEEIADDKKADLETNRALVQTHTGAGLAEKKESPNLAARNKDASVSITLRQMAGKVISAEDGTPLPGVNIVVKGTSQGTFTDSNGMFSLPVTDEKKPLVFSFIGMHSSEVVPGGKNNIEVKLSEDVSNLSEVVVTGQALDDPNHIPVIKNASPVGGIKAYNKYLEDNLRYPAQALADNIKGKVTIQFTIDPNGTLSEFNVLKGIGHGCDDEVIRLVKEGPRWSPTTIDTVPVETEVKVRLKFDPGKAK